MHATPPDAGAIDYIDGGGATAPSVTFSVDADEQPGSYRLERSAAPWQVTCGATYGAWTNTGAVSSPFADDGAAADTCVRYRLVTTDAVGNVTITTSDHVYAYVPVG